MILESLSVVMVQLNPVVGALAQNRREIIAGIESAMGRGAALVVFPELATVGYPPRDLLELPAFVAESEETLEMIAQATAAPGAPAVIVGHVMREEIDGACTLRNAATLVADGRCLHRWGKRHLPTYDVFDEARYFVPTDATGIATYRGWRIGVTICEDIWVAGSREESASVCTASSDHYASDPAREQIAQGADLLVNISASPFELGKPSVRRNLVSELAREGRVPVLYCNQVGGNDDLVFDGGSFAVNAEGALIAQGPSWVAATVPVRVGDPSVACLDVATVDPVAEVLSALELGLRDYARKCGFTDVVVGLSGGIDSAVTAAIAARALGPDRVVGLIMPSPHSSDHSVDDARALADNLGVRVHTLPIGPTMEAFDEALDQVFEGQPSDVTEENIQARIRGSLLMAYSNKFGHLVLTTGNKSELAVGYCTLYGDMCGGLALLSDVPKMMVYALAHLMNSGPDQVIPKNTIHKPPSAELRPGQQDSDSLPPYEVLDGIIEAYIEDGKDEDAIVQMGFSKEVVKEVVALIHRNEYKRRQAAPGLKVTSKAFGVGRRFPIAHRRG